MNLYSYVPSPGENTPVTVKPVKVDDLVPMEDEIEEAIKKLRRNRSGGASEMRADHLKGVAYRVQKEKKIGRERGG